MKRFFAFLMLSVLAITSLFAAPFTFKKGQPVRLVFEQSETDVVKTAIDMFTADYEKVFGDRIGGGAPGDIFVGTLGSGSEAERRLSAADRNKLAGQWEAFVITTGNDGKLTIVGSDKRGTAYGVLELSRMVGVSPWEWWADAVPDKKESVTIGDNFYTFQQPSVKHRGIFLNDEDWGLTPWSWKNHEPSDIEGQIGPKTHARIFELLLRLRANTFWPAMHECSVPFYLTPGNREMAEKYAIFVGTSHCEPMVRNTNGEWRVAGTGPYDYVNNRENVVAFWEERVKELVNSDNIYTLGIRGVHDGKMQGANTIQEQHDAIVDIFVDQRNLIAQYKNPDVTKVPQAFIPYKEVLEVYNAGLEVPEDVTLMWCDDNYGYIRHLPTAEERARPGGNGVYYHVSYWGRPHDYLWLSTNHPALVYTQMKRAYDYGAQEMWILNVGDIKPAEYQIELFMDMGWDIDAIENSEAGLQKHLTDWLSREFGAQTAEAMLPALNEYYRLAYIRKPEHMGGTRVEESDRKWLEIADLPWSEEEIRERINDYSVIEERVIRLSEQIPGHKKSTWFQLVEYPVRGAANMNYKHLYGQLARHGKADWIESSQAYDTIDELTARYNALEGGKWQYMMDFQPRKLSVFGRVPQVQATEPMAETEPALFSFNGKDYKSYKGTEPVGHGLGYENGAVSLAKGAELVYAFQYEGTGTMEIELALTPNHPVEGQTLRYAISVDGAQPQEIEYRTWERSEEWKLNVFRNQAIRTTTHSLKPGVDHTVVITALDDGVILDQIKVREMN